MSLSFAQQFLVVILSVTLAVFLILSIIAMVKVIQVLNKIKEITQKAEKLADQAEHVGEFFKKSAGPAAIVNLVANIAHTFKSKKGE